MSAQIAAILDNVINNDWFTPPLGISIEGANVVEDSVSGRSVVFGLTTRRV